VQVLQQIGWQEDRWDFVVLVLVLVQVIMIKAVTGFDAAGFVTRNLLTMPVKDRDGRLLAVVQVIHTWLSAIRISVQQLLRYQAINKRHGAFSSADEDILLVSASGIRANAQTGTHVTIRMLFIHTHISEYAQYVWVFTCT
jgi:hypothetical protein